MADEQSDHYNYFPAMTIGGPTGDYEIISPVPSGRWAEYSIVAIANGDTGSSSVFVSGRSAPVQLLYNGSQTMNKDAFVPGIAARVAATTTSYPALADFEKVTHSQQKVFVRIDVTGGGSCFVTLKFREKLHTVIPGPTPATSHSDHGHQMNIARSEKTSERLQKMGVPMEVEYHS